jgi:hypothetical protein
VNAAFDMGREIVPILKDVLAYGSDKQLESLWYSLGWSKGALSEVTPLLDEAIARKQYYPVVAVVREAELAKESERKLAAKYLAALADTPQAMAAAEIGRSRKLLSDKEVLAIARDQIKVPTSTYQCIQLLADLGTEEDLKLIADSPPPGNDFRVYFDNFRRALAVRRIISRIEK